jgi:hypothetical protein
MGPVDGGGIVTMPDCMMPPGPATGDGEIPPDEPDWPIVSPGAVPDGVMSLGSPKRASLRSFLIFMISFLKRPKISNFFQIRMGSKVNRITLSLLIQITELKSQ